MNDGLQRERTWPSAIVLLLLAVGVIILIAVGAYALTQPGVLESTLKLIALIVVVIVALAIILYAVLMFISVPLYALKGTVYQTDRSYGLDKVESVKEKDL